MHGLVNLSVRWQESDENTVASRVFTGEETLLGLKMSQLDQNGTT